MLTFEQIKELVELVAERKLAGLEVERSGFRLRIDGRAEAPVAAVSAPAPASAPAAAPQAAAPAPAPAAPAPAGPAAAPAA